MKIFHQILLWILVSSTLCSSENSGRKLKKQERECTWLPHDEVSVERSMAKAKPLIKRFKPEVNMENRLAIMILFTHGFSPSHPNRLDLLRCSLEKLKRNLNPKTPADIFVWTLNSSAVSPIIPDWLNPTNFPNVHIMSIEEETWRVPCGLAPDRQWAVRQHFYIDYYLMGRWRLTFSFDFARAMGYKYHLQFDDDAMLNSPIDFNLVEMFRRKSYLMGVYSDLVGEVPQVVLGLPELTRFWLSVSRFQPKGVIYQHVNPHDISGLHSGSWDRLYHPGYFMLIDVDFWFSAEVQDYLTTVIRSGKDVEGRWQEQAVINMIRLIFIPPAQLWLLDGVEVGHDRHKAGLLNQWCGEILKAAMT